MLNGHRLLLLQLRMLRKRVALVCRFARPSATPPATTRVTATSAMPTTAAIVLTTTTTILPVRVLDELGALEPEILHAFKDSIRITFLARIDHKLAGIGL